MNPNHEHELEALVDRELKSLPPLSAPPGLASRILATIAAQASAPWYRRAWQTWPAGLQAGSFALLVAMFGGLCLGGWKLTHLAENTVAAQKVSGLFSLLDLAWNTVNVLLTALSQAIQHVGTGYLLAALTVVLLGYAAFVALGSVYLRFALVRR
jgi:hypothetical protein